MGNAYRIPGARDRLRKQQQQIRDLQADNRNRNTPKPVAATAISGSSAAGSTGGGTGNFLSTEGGTMIGPLALKPPVDFTVDIDADNTIDISPSNTSQQYSSNIQIEDVPTSDTLDIIKGAAFDGQILIIRTFAPPTITISQGDLGNGGNIQTPDGNDVTVGDLQIIILVYDDSLMIESNTGGSWRLINTFGAGSGGPFLPTAGGTMLGPIGFDPEVKALSNHRLDITEATGAYSSYVLVTGQGTPDYVKFIDGAVFNGQDLDFQGTNQQAITLKFSRRPTITNIVGTGVGDNVIVTVASTDGILDGDEVNILNTTNFNLDSAIVASLTATTFEYDLGSAASLVAEFSGDVQDGNIESDDGTDILLDGLSSLIGVPIISLKFDPSGTLGGVWRNVGISSSTSGGANTALSNLITTSINEDLLPDSNSTRNLGESGLQWNNLWIDTLQNATTVVIASPNFAINSAQITLGDAITDEITFLGRVDNTGIIPLNNSASNLGASGQQWNTLWIDTLDNATTVVIASPNFAINSAQITLGDAVSDNISFLGQVANNIVMEEITEPGVAPANTGRFYAKDDGGLTNPFWKDEAGNESNLISSGTNLLPLDNTWTGINTFTGTTFNVQTTAINLGDATTDSINFLGRAGTNLVPIANSTHNLGISGLQWNTLWIDTLQNATTVVIASPNFAMNSAQITLGDAVSDNISFLGQVANNIVMEEITEPGVAPTDTGRFYAKVDGGVSVPFWKDEAGTETSMIAGGAAGANTALSNLITTDINQNLLPDSNSARNLGASGLQWNTLWIDTLTNASAVTFTSPITNLNSAQTRLGDASSDNLQFLGQVSTNIVIEEITEPGNAPTNTGRFYAKVDGGVSVPFWKDEAGTETSMIAGGAAGANTALSNLITTDINQNLLPDGDATRDLGSSALEWQAIFVQQINATSTTAVVSPTFSINSSTINLGDATSDDINFLGRVDSHLDPSGNNTQDLGNFGLEWANLWVTTLQNNGAIAVASPTFSINSSTINLGDATSDDINFLGRVDSDVDPSSDDAFDLGSPTLAWKFIYDESGVAIIEGYATGFRPGFQINTGVLFTVPTAGGKTELRCGFQSGASQIIATEP